MLFSKRFVIFFIELVYSLRIFLSIFAAEREQGFFFIVCSAYCWCIRWLLILCVFIFSCSLFTAFFDIAEAFPGSYPRFDNRITRKQWEFFAFFSNNRIHQSHKTSDFRSLHPLSASQDLNPTWEETKYFVTPPGCLLHPHIIHQTVVFSTLWLLPRHSLLFASDVVLKFACLAGFTFRTRVKTALSSSPAHLSSKRVQRKQPITVPNPFLLL